MSYVATRVPTLYGVYEQGETQSEIVSVSDSGCWILRLPPSLIEHQSELERLLSKVFANLPKSPENIALAKQMSLNWCVSKCKQNGLRFEECMTAHHC